MIGGYIHPATARRLELLRQGYTVIAKNIPLDGAKKYPAGSIWITTGEVFAPPAIAKLEAAE